MDKQSDSPLKCGWRGHLNGAVEGTAKTEVVTSEITLRLDRETAWALANHLTDRAIKDGNAVGESQAKALSNLGAAIGRLIDHGAANNGGRNVIKP